MHELKSFTPCLDVTVLANLRHAGAGLKFDFEVQSKKVVGGPAPGQWTAWERGDELWRSTCFEAFIRLPNQAEYWELNVSPGQRKWNLYYFNAYREPSPPAPVPDFELTEILTTPTTLSCELRGPAPWPALEVNLCAVIVTEDQGTQYFALRHPGPKPDFHASAGFKLKATPGGGSSPL